MGLEFGNLPVRIRRVVYYGLTPFEQKTWAKAISHGVPNMIRRTLSAIPIPLPVFAIMGYLPIWANAEWKRANRKDPDAYANDE